MKYEIIKDGKIQIKQISEINEPSMSHYNFPSDYGKFAPFEFNRYQNDKRIDEDYINSRKTFDCDPELEELLSNRYNSGNKQIDASEIVIKNNIAKKSNHNYDL